MCQLSRHKCCWLRRGSLVTPPTARTHSWHLAADILLACSKSGLSTIRTSDPPCRDHPCSLPGSPAMGTIAPDNWTCYCVICAFFWHAFFLLILLKFRLCYSLHFCDTMTTQPVITLLSIAAEWFWTLSCWTWLQSSAWLLSWLDIYFLSLFMCKSMIWDKYTRKFLYNPSLSPSLSHLPPSPSPLPLSQQHHWQHWLLAQQCRCCCCNTERTQNHRSDFHQSHKQIHWLEWGQLQTRPSAGTVGEKADGWQINSCLT